MATVIKPKIKKKILNLKYTHEVGHMQKYEWILN